MSGMGRPSSYTVEKFRGVIAPLVDVRSPKEFASGHYPGAINLPLFSDNERKEVGTTYKEAGRQEAIVLGLKFTASKLEGLAEALESLATYRDANSKKVLKIYCWRGGMRSASVAWLANLLKLSPLILRGGYQSYRHWVLKQFEKEWPIHLLGGRTGTGKTDLLIELERKGVSVIDLEGLANHRGSSFGGLGLPIQPTTEHYENLLAEALSRSEDSKGKFLWLEAESVNLGRCRIPHSFFKQMKVAPLLEITRADHERIKRLIDVYSPNGIKALEEATLRISRRLGPQRTSEALEALKVEGWERACRSILDYYDRCYEHELKKVPQRKSVDISGLSSSEAAKILLGQGSVS